MLDVYLKKSNWVFTSETAFDISLREVVEDILATKNAEGLIYIYVNDQDRHAFSMAFSNGIVTYQSSPDVDNYRSAKVARVIGSRVYDSVAFNIILDPSITGR